MSTRARSTWSETLRMSVVVLVCYGLGVMGWRVFFVPKFSPLRLGEPALERPVEYWRTSQKATIFRYGDAGPNALAIAGDSRVQRGIVLASLSESGFDEVFTLTRPAGLTLELLTLLDERAPGRAVISLTPLGLHNDLQDPPKNLPFPRRFDDWTSDWADMYRRRLAEPLIPPVWRFGWFGGFGQDKFIKSFTWSLRPETRAARLGKLHEVEKFLAALRTKGWQLVCVRMPVYESMRNLEDEAFDPGLFEATCAAAGVPFWDYGVVENETSDGSHLGVGGARRFSTQLAQDLKQAGF